MAYDLGVIGGGPAGYVAALKAAQLGARVLVVEKERVGGTCLNVGCVPTKTLLFNAKLYRYLLDGASLGLNVDALSLDFSVVQRRKQRVVDKFVRGVQYLLKKHGVDVAAGDARIETATRITVEEGDSSRAFDVGKIILATGSSPARLDFPGVEHTLNSTEALSLDHPPESMVIIGAGAIGVEFAVIFGSFGTKVTLVELMDSVLPFEDKEITHLLTKSLEKSGITVLSSSTMSSVEKKAEGLQSRVKGLSGEREILSEAVLLSVGRRPNLDACANLDLSGERGFVEVNDSMETKLPGVYAAGDVCGKFLLAYTASKEGEVAALNALGHPSRMSYEYVPRLIYSHPEVGAVGLTEEQASKEREIVVGRFPMMGNSRAYAEMEPEGMVKVVADKTSGLLLGVHILGPYATELVLSPTIMLERKMTVTEAAKVTYGHPSFAETIREALLDAAGCPLHK